MSDEYTGKTLSGKYQVEELLRKSEFGNVYRGRHLLMEKPVAIKILSPALAVDEAIVERFSSEARLISRLSHPNILNVTDFGKDDFGTVFIVMEDAEGKTLAETIKDEGALSPDRAVSIARQISAGLSSAHANLMAHRRLTSDNVLLTKMANGTEIAKIFDIGSFNAAFDEASDSSDSIEALAFLSPEQCSGESEGDERSDIYSLGIILYQMLVGEVPFMADDKTELMLKHAEVPPPPFTAFRDDIPAEIEPVVIQALAKNPDMRYQAVSALAEDLAAAVSDEDAPNAIVIPAAGPLADAAAANNVWKTAFIVLAGACLLAFGMIYWTKSNQTEPGTVQNTDENGVPVQPLNPATGLNEQNVKMSDYPTNSMDPNQPLIQPDVGGGDGYDPWARPGTPPGGNPSYQPISPGGERVTIPGNSGSVFTQDEPVGYDEKGNPIYLIRRPVKSPTPVTKTDADPKTDPSAKPTPKASPAKTGDPKGTKPPAKTDKPAEKPKPKPAAPKPTPGKAKPKSGVERDS